MLPFVLVILLVRFWMPFSLLISLIAVIRWTVVACESRTPVFAHFIFAKKVVFTQHSRPYTKFFNPRMSSSPGIIADSVPTDFITTQRRGCCFSPLFYCWYQHFQHVAQLETGPKNPAHFINPAPQQPFNPSTLTLIHHVVGSSSFVTSVLPHPRGQWHGVARRANHFCWGYRRSTWAMESVRGQ